MGVSRVLNPTRARYSSAALTAIGEKCHTEYLENVVGGEQRGPRVLVVAILLLSAGRMALSDGRSSDKQRDSLAQTPQYLKGHVPSIRSMQGLLFLSEPLFL